MVSDRFLEYSGSFSSVAMSAVPSPSSIWPSSKPSIDVQKRRFADTHPCGLPPGVFLVVEVFPLCLMHIERPVRKDAMNLSVCADAPFLPKAAIHLL